METLLSPLLSQPVPALCIPLALFAAFLMGFTRSAFGAGGFVVSPLMVLALGPTDGLAVVAPLMILSGSVSCWQHREGLSRETLSPLLLAAVVGTFAGGCILWLLMRSGELALIHRRMELVVGGLALVYVILVALKDKLHARVPYDPARWSLFLAGSGVSLSQTVSNTGTPILLSFFLYHGWAKERFVANQAWFLMAQNLAKLVPFIALGILHSGNIGTSLLLLPLSIIGNITGAKLFKCGSEKLFFGLLLALLLLGFLASVLLLIGRSRLWN